MTFLPKKVYLNGADTFHLMMERNRELVKEGNNQIVLCIQLKDKDALAEIQQNIRQSEFLHWLVNLKVVNPFIGVPFLKQKTQHKTISIIKNGIQQEKFPRHLLHQTLMIKKSEFIRFDTFIYQEIHYLFISFHHALFDGKGAALVVKHICGDLPINQETISQLIPKKLKWKNTWKQWVNLIQIKKTIESTNKGETAYLKPIETKENGFHLLSHVFTDEETQIIQQHAKENGSRFGLNFYQVACLAKAFRLTLNLTNELWVPIPYNGRKRGTTGTIISNYTSFLFHRIQVNETSTKLEIVQQLQHQMNDQLGMQLPEKYNDLLQLMRFFPNSFNHYVTTKSSKGKIASFLYSSTEIEQHKNQFIEDQWILPPFSYPPGLTVNFYLKNNQLNFHMAYANKTLSKQTIEQLKNALIQQLLNA